MNEAVKIGSYEDDDYSCLQVLIETVSSAKHISSFVFYHLPIPLGFQLFQHAEGLDF